MTTVQKLPATSEHKGSYGQGRSTTSKSEWRFELSSDGDDFKSEFGGHWGEHPDHPVQDWQAEVANDDTRMGYWPWVASQVSTAESL